MVVFITDIDEINVLDIAKVYDFVYLGSRNDSHNATGGYVEEQHHTTILLLWVSNPAHNIPEKVETKTLITTQLVRDSAKHGIDMVMMVMAQYKSINT